MIAIEVTLTEYIEFDKTSQQEAQNIGDLQIKLLPLALETLKTMFNARTTEDLMQTLNPIVANYILNRPNIETMVGDTFEITYDFLDGVSMALSMVSPRY